jgi:hypothetical protein
MTRKRREAMGDREADDDDKRGKTSMARTRKFVKQTTKDYTDESLKAREAFNVVDNGRRRRRRLERGGETVESEESETRARGEQKYWCFSRVLKTGLYTKVL